MLAAGAAALIAGCSDASRFSADPFSNPFKTASSGVDRTATGAIDAPPDAATSGRVQSKPLPPPAAAAASRPAPVAQAPTPAGAYGHWRAEGGTPIVIAQGETAGMLANRYGVPADVLLRVNGYANTAQVQPGARLVIPVYNANAAPAQNPVAQAPEPKPAAAKPAKSTAEAAPAAKRPGKRAEAPAEAPANAARVAEDRPEPARMRAAEAKRHALEAIAAAPAPAETAKARVAKAEPAPKPEAAPEAKPARPQRVAKAAPPPARVAETPAPAEKRVAKAPEPAPERPAEPARTATIRVVDATPTASIPPASTQPAREQKAETTTAVATTEDTPGKFRWPAKGRIIQGFTNGGNDGINIAVPEGTQVKAAEEGVVAYAGSELKGYGNLVLIRHQNGFVTAYAHNGEIAVKRGDKVVRGQTIAKSGQSGDVGSPQLHFELRKNSKPVDPTVYLAGV